MEVLKFTRETIGKGKHVGGKIPPQLFSFLCLYSASKGIGKSETIRGALELWKSQVESEEQLMNSLITRIQNEWNIYKSQRESYSEFISLVEEKLRRKGLGVLCIRKIVEKIKK